MKYEINRKRKEVTFSIGDSKESLSFSEVWAFVYLLLRKIASSHRG